MIITDRFIYIHQPKTGGSFVASSLMKLHGARWSRLHHLFYATTGYIRWNGPFGQLIMTAGKHAACEHIPKKYLGRPIFTNMRNPLDYYVSQYEFEWWKRKEYRKYYRQAPDFEAQFPNFPELSFEQYLRLMAGAFNNEKHRDFNSPEDIGHFTTTFIRYFFREPEKVLAEKVSSRYFQSGDYQADMYPVHFIHTHQLNRQLYDYLLEQGYPKEAIRFILDKERVLPLGKGRTKDQKWQKYYSPDLIKLIRQKDRFLFQLFPEYQKYASADILKTQP